MTLQRCFFRKKWLVNERRLTDMNRRLTVVSPTSILFTYVFCCWVNSLNASPDQWLKDLVYIHAYHHFLYQGWDEKVATCTVLVSLLKQNDIRPSWLDLTKWLKGEMTVNWIGRHTLLDVVIRKCSAIFQLLASKYKTLLIWGNSWKANGFIIITSFKTMKQRY